MSIIEKSSFLHLSFFHTRLFNISGSCFLLLAVQKTSHPCPRWRTKSERRHFQVQHEWNKIILLYSTDELDPVRSSGASHQHLACMRHRLSWKKTKRAGLVWFHVEDEDDEMRGGEGMRGSSLSFSGSVSSWVHSSSLAYITGSGWRMWIETDDKNCVFVCVCRWIVRGFKGWVLPTRYFLFVGPSNQHSLSTIVQSLVNCTFNT